jgi:hypothetical protein
MRKVLVVGCAASVWVDVAAAQAMAQFDAVYCVKLAGVDWPERFDVWCGLHPEWQEDYSRQRAAKGLPNGYQTVAPPDSELGAGKCKVIDRRVSYRWPGMNASASSGIYGAKVALDDGFDRVVLAGVPLSKDPHFSRGKPWVQVDSFTAGFRLSVPFLMGKVRSMSGLTREVLGAPTPEWLAGDPQS